MCEPIGLEGPVSPMDEELMFLRMSEIERAAGRHLSDEELEERMLASLSEPECRWILRAAFREQFEAAAYAIDPESGLPRCLPTGPRTGQVLADMTAAEIRRFLNNPAEEDRFSPEVRARLAALAARLDPP